MDVILSDLKVVQMRGYSTQLKIFPEDTAEIDDCTFVRIRPYAKGWVNLICESNESAPLSYKKDRFSLTSSCGFMDLIELRNQAAAAAETHEGHKSTLFDEPTPEKLSFPKSTRTDQKRKREDLTTVTFPVSCDGVTMDITLAKPVHPKDAVWIKFDIDTMGHVIKFMRDSGFTDEKKQKSAVALGVYQASPGKFVACFALPDNTKRYHTTTCLQDALTWQERMKQGQYDVDDTTCEHADS